MKDDARHALLTSEGTRMASGNPPDAALVPISIHRRRRRFKAVGKPSAA